HGDRRSRQRGVARGRTEQGSVDDAARDRGNAGGGGRPDPRARLRPGGSQGARGKGAGLRGPDRRKGRAMKAISAAAVALVMVLAVAAAWAQEPLAVLTEIQLKRGKVEV